MKPRILTIASVMLMFVGVVACGEDEQAENEDNIVSFALCSCWTEQVFDTCSLTALFLKDADAAQALSDAYKDNIARVVYFSESDSAYIYKRHKEYPVLHSINIICNFPEFAKHWESKTTVYLEGIRYQPCNHFGGIATLNYFDIILTKLTISKKVQS
jgi:hypothetical protein